MKLFVPVSTKEHSITCVERGILTGSCRWDLKWHLTLEGNGSHFLFLQRKKHRLKMYSDLYKATRSVRIWKRGSRLQTKNHFTEMGEAWTPELILPSKFLFSNTSNDIKTTTSTLFILQSPIWPQATSQSWYQIFSSSTILTATERRTKNFQGS